MDACIDYMLINSFYVYLFSERRKRSAEEPKYTLLGYGPLVQNVDELKVRLSNRRPRSGKTVAYMYNNFF